MISPQAWPYRYELYVQTTAKKGSVNRSYEEMPKPSSSFRISASDSIFLS